MQSASNQSTLTTLNERLEEKPVGRLPVVKSFRKVIESRSMEEMTKELYDFLNLYCGFIAHYNIHGFRQAYAAPRDFTDVFMRHFDREHRYFNAAYRCHEEPYRDTGFTKAEIKQEFSRIVDKHKEAISRWADGVEKDRRYAAFLVLKNEFEGNERNVRMECELCGENIDVLIRQNTEGNRALENLCCILCGEPVRIKGEVNG